MIYSRYAAPLNEWVVPEGTLSWASGTVDASYPASEAKDGDSASATKITGTSGTLRATLGGSRLAVGAAIFWTNATSISLQNGAGLNVAMTPMARDGDGYINASWIDLTGIALTTSNVWDWVLSKSGSQPIEVGEIRLVKTWSDIPLLYGIKTARRRPGNELLTTRLGSELEWVSNVRAEAWGGTLNQHDYLDAMRELEAQSSGSRMPFVLIPNTTINRAVLVKFPHGTDFEHVRADSTSSVIDVKLIEPVSGVAPSAA